MIEKGRLLSLVEFVQQSARLRAKPFSTVSQHGQFAIYEHQFRSLPGIHFNRGDSESDDETWLVVDRLHERKPPEPDSAILHPWIVVSQSPSEEPRLSDSVDGKNLIAAGTHRSAHEPIRREDTSKPPIDANETVLLSGFSSEIEVRAQFESYVKTVWRPWASEEELRRKSIRLYAQLFTLKQQLEGGIVEAQLELVWGVGIGIWKSQGNNISYPLVTRLVELSLNLTTAQIEVRPRDIDARLELDWYASVDNPGVPDLERVAREFFQSTARTFSPFDRATFEPLLRSAVTHLDGNGVYWPNETQAEDRTLPAVRENLCVTDTWVLFARPRTQSVFLQDLERLKGAIESVEDPRALPAAVAAIVIDPTDHNPVVELPTFRGVTVSYHGNDGRTQSTKRVRELYFPKPFNAEQVRIVQLLEASDGVVVQGPPGTGKTHTIANVICHYLAEGKRVLVTSMKDPALAVLQTQLPDDIQPLAISLLSSEQAGMKQFEHAIQKIASEVQVLDRNSTAREIRNLTISIDALHGRLFTIDRRVNDWANRNLGKFALDGDEVAPLDAAYEVRDGEGQFEWLPDELGVTAEFAPQFTNDDVSALRSARRQLGKDIDYLGASLPQIVEFPDSAELLQIHRDLSQYERLKASVDAGEIPTLSMPDNESVDRLHETASRAAALSDILAELKAVGDDWPTRTRNGSGNSGGDLFALLEALGADLNEAARSRTTFVEKPVHAPAAIELDDDIVTAVSNLSQGRRPFGLAGVLGRSKHKQILDEIRVLGRRPEGPSQWKHVHDYLELQRRLRALGLRWNALASELAFPAVDASSPNGALAAAAHYEIYLKVKRSGDLIEVVRAAALSFFPRWEAAIQVGSDDEALLKLQGALQHHILRQRLANVWIAKDRFQKILEGRSGRIVIDIRQFIDSCLGNPEILDSEMQSYWSGLMVELSRALGLRSHLETVRTTTARVELSGAPNYAAALRRPFAGTVDNLLPDNWRKAWRLKRLATHLASIDPRDELKVLAVQRREVQDYLARAYRDVVVKQTWLKLAENASPSIRAALQSYLAAIQRIGKGTGKRAVRFRQDARQAATRANAAVPCWIMPHYRVSESLPPELGCFDLVIIDEASQSDLTALPALLRARKVLVVGDHKQVSPEGVGLEEEKVRNLMARFLADQVRTYRPQMDPSRSIYDLFKVVFASNSVMLKEHFRCVPPIIEYSKREFYDHELRPLRLPKASERLDPPLIDVLIEDGFRNGDINRAEANFIVEEIKQIVSDPKLTTRSIGVVSLLADKQAMAIWERLTEELGPETMQRHRIACGDARTFQGNERDIMFLSMIAAPNDMGAPLSRDTFAQRFNVAASRARDRMYLVRSVGLEQLSQADRLRRSLISHFAAPFSQDEIRVADLRKRCESPFELEVYDLLVERGYRVMPQVKVGQYRIDMVVDGDNDSRLAIECDGDKYHGPDKWADDMQRQGDLERAGWSFWRCFASTFVRRRAEVVADLLKTLSEHGVGPIGLENAPKGIHTEQRRVSASLETERQPPVDLAATGAHGERLDQAQSEMFHRFAVSNSPSQASERPTRTDRQRTTSSSVSPTSQDSTGVSAILDFCRTQNLRVIDNRPKNGALWVAYPQSEGSTARALKQLGLRFAPGKGWWMK